MIDSKGLTRRIELGEDSNLELKQVFLKGSRVIAPKRTRLADVLAGMANSRKGGVVVLGAADNTQEIVGIPMEHLNAVEEWASEICNDSVEPPLEVTITKLRLPNPEGVLVPVICIEVSGGSLRLELPLLTKYPLGL